jgi:hypothetical protein
MGAAFLFSIYRSPILNSHQNCPRMKERQQWLSGRARNLYLYTKQMYHVE